MPSEQLLIRLPDDLLRRLKQAVPSRKRSAFVQQLIEQALPADDDPLYRAALTVEQDEQLAREMAEWEVATSNDGLTDPRRNRRR
jgi:hypothetical protein